MSTLRRLFLPLCALLLALAPLPSDTSLDGLWFKVKVKASGYVIEPDGLVPHKFSGSETAYVHLTLNDVSAQPAPGDDLSLPFASYRYDIWTKDESGAWALRYWDSDDFESTDGSMYFVPDLSCELYADTGARLEAYMTCAIKVKRDKEGQVKSATFASLGGEIYDGTLDGDDAVRGGVTVKGALVKASKLPFTP